MWTEPLRRVLAVAFPALLCLAFLAPLASADTLRRKGLVVGQQVSIPAAGIVKYSEGSSGIVDVRLPEDGAEFIVVGLRPGESTLLLIREDGEKLRYHFQVRERSSFVPKRHNIRLDLYFVELRSSGGHQVGVNWPASIGADIDVDVELSAAGIGPASASLSSLPLPRLDLLQKQDWARISQQATLIASNGEEARLDSGGVVHVEVSGSLAAELREIPFGTRLRVLPRYDPESGRLELRVDAEVSSLSEGRVPSRTRSALSTVVNVERNQALVLGGIRSQQRSHSGRGLPLLSKIPVLGTLFGTHGERWEERQHLLFIVPSIIDPVSSRSREMILEALDAARGFEGTMPAKGLPGLPEAVRR